MFASKNLLHLSANPAPETFVTEDRPIPHRENSTTLGVLWIVWNRNMKITLQYGRQAHQTYFKAIKRLTYSIGFSIPSPCLPKPPPLQPIDLSSLIPRFSSVDGAELKVSVARLDCEPKLSKSFLPYSLIEWNGFFTYNSVYRTNFSPESVAFKWQKWFRNLHKLYRSIVPGSSLLC